MRSLSFLRITRLCIIIYGLLLSACNQSSEEVPANTINHCGEKGYLTILVKYVGKTDTLCLLPQEVIMNQMVDSVQAETDKRVDNYNPGFINMILTPTTHLLVFSKENHYDISVMERWIDGNYDLGFESHLNIDGKGRGAYHISYDPGEKPFEIQFTPAFAKILQILKNQK